MHSLEVINAMNDKAVEEDFSLTEVTKRAVGELYSIHNELIGQVDDQILQNMRFCLAPIVTFIKRNT